MKKKLAFVLCLALAVAIGVGGTLAYLTATDTVTNTFTVGNVKILMDEAKVNEYGQLVDEKGAVYKDSATQTLADRVKTNEYKLVPGASYVKDPTVTVEKGSEASYVFMKVEYEGNIDQVLVALEINNGWIQLTDGSGAPVAGVYYMEVAAVAADNDNELTPLFDEIVVRTEKIPDNVGDPAEPVDFSVLGTEPSIVVNAYAIQQSGFASAALAYAELVTVYMTP